MDPDPAAPSRELALVALQAPTAADRPTVRPSEDESACGLAFQGVAALVQQPVMPATELDEVPELGPASVRPMLDVVRVHEAVFRAAGEAAAAVAAPQGPREGRRNGSGPAADG